MTQRYAVSRAFLTERFIFALSQRDQQLLIRLARHEGEPAAVVLRRLVREAAAKKGITAEGEAQRGDQAS